MARMTDARLEAGAVAEALAAAPAVLVASHKGIDGDSAGAALALLRALRRRGARVACVNAEPPPGHLRFLPSIDEVRPPDAVEGDFALALVLDTSSPDLLGDRVAARLGGARVVLVDHHVPKGPWGDVRYVDPSASSTCEQAFEILGAMNEPLDAAAATLLFTGLVTDTWSFQQTNTTARTLEVAAACVRAGARPYEIAREVYERVRPGRARLHGLALSRIRLAAGGRIVWTTVARADLDAVGASDEDFEGLAQDLRAVDGIEIAVLGRETADGGVKVNFRSKGAADVAALARRFGGGGHVGAAAATMRGPTLAEGTARAVTAAEEALG